MRTAHSLAKLHYAVTARRFAATMGMEGRELVSTVARMSVHAKGAIPDREFEQIGASLFVRRCTTCHDESVVSRLLLRPERERMPYLREKVGRMKTTPRSRLPGRLSCVAS